MTTEYPVLQGMRKPRRLVEGARYHVVARANRREFILESPAVKTMLLDIVARARERFSFSIDTLCIMDNHIHILLWPGRGESLSRIMQWVLSVFARRFNRLIGVNGHVWYDRFKSVVVRTLSQLKHACTYIAENPVRAQMINRASDYRFGSAGVRRFGPPGVLDPPGPLAVLLLGEPNSIDRLLPTLPWQ
jgi:putative transposase